MRRAIVVIVICSFRLGWVTPHQQDDGQDSDGPVRQAPMRSLRPTGWCRVSVRAGPTDRLQDSPKGRQPVLMESDLARAHTHTLTSSPSGVVDRQRPTQSSLPDSGATRHASRAPAPPPPLDQHQPSRTTETVRITQLHRDPVVGLRSAPARRASRPHAGRLHPNDHLADAFFDLKHPKTGQSQHLLGQPGTVVHCRGPTVVVSLRTAATMVRSLTSVLDAPAPHTNPRSPLNPEDPEMS